MAKTKKVKWALGGSEPEDLQDFLSNEDILKKNSTGKGKNREINWPGRGPFRCKVRFLKVKPNRNGDDRLSVMLVIDEPKGSDAASWNNYAMFDGFNITEQGAPFLKRFLKGLGLSWSDFIERSVQDDQDPPHIVQIGKVKFEGSKDVHVLATVKVKPADEYNDDEHMEPQRYQPLDDDADEDSSEDEEAAEDFSKPSKKGKKKKKGKGKKSQDDPPF